MFDDDVLPQKKKPVLKDLSKLSVDELHDYIDHLQSEITRTDNEIKRKKTVADAAALFFKQS
jgi:uncharacterized small protein (DUF1192 family)